MDIELPKSEYFNEVNMEFHDHLKRLRESQGLTQAQVADAVDLAKNTYIGYEKGTREPRLSDLLKLASLFRIDVGELCLEAQSAGLSGWLKATLRRVDSLKAKEKNALLEVVNGYMTACEVAQISNSTDYNEFMDDQAYRHHVAGEIEDQALQEYQEEQQEDYSSNAEQAV